MKIWSNEEEASRLAARFVGVNQAAFARQHKVPGGASMLSQHIKGRRPMNLAAAMAYAAGFGVPLEEISPRLAEEVKAAASTRQRPAAFNAINLIENPDYPAVRRVRFKLSAGASGFAVEYLDDDDAPIVFRRQWFDSNGYDPEKLFAVRVANGSMEPGLYHGDTVVVNTAQADPKDGVVFAVNYEGELVIKRLVRDAGQWWLCSDNPDQHRYPRKVCHEGTFIIGEVVHKQSERI